MSTFMPRDSLTFSVKSNSKKELGVDDIAQDAKVLLKPVLEAIEEEDKP